MERPDLYIESMDCVRVEDLATWFEGDIEKAYLENHADEADEASEDAAGDTEGPSGKGWVIELTGRHYFNQDRTMQGAEYVRRTLIDFMENEQVTLPTGDGSYSKFSFQELGIGYPVLTSTRTTETGPEPEARRPQPAS